MSIAHVLSFALAMIVDSPTGASTASTPPASPPSEPLVSVLLAVRDGARFLPAALRSLDAQSYRPIELVAVDDGSTDETGELLRAFAATRPWVRLLRAEGVGPAGARALAFQASRGSVIAVHDADDESRPDRLRIQLDYLREHPDVGVLGSAAEVIGEDGRRLAAYPVPLGDGAIRRLLRRAPPFVHGSVAMRRAVYEAAGGYRAPFRCAEDFDLWLRVPAGVRFENLPEALYRWRSHDANTFSRQRDRHLFFAAVAREFAEERASRGGDSVALLEASADANAFLGSYDRAERVQLRLGESLVREGRTADARERLRAALLAPRTFAAAAWWWALSWPVGLLPRARRARRARVAPPARTERGA
ncbi:MAG TPA: glycosyltransferase [Candidatus Eisenbacteria bacterium]|nr:glycosyltransferase [Candidatus Eisenbacteria bacterium]